MLRTMPKPRTPGASTVRTTLDLPVPLWKRAKMQAMEEHRDLRDLLLDALRRYLGQRKGDGPLP
jgi:hypothetical protein